MYPYQMNGIYQNQFQPSMMQAQQIIKVNGENGARAFQMAPNSSVLLLDESAPIVWLAQTDGAGYKTVNPYRIEPYTKPEEPDFGSILKRIEKLEGIVNAKSNTSNAEQT